MNIGLLKFFNDFKPQIEAIEATSNYFAHLRGKYSGGTDWDRNFYNSQI